MEQCPHCGTKLVFKLADREIACDRWVCPSCLYECCVSDAQTENTPSGNRTLLG